MKNTLRVYTIFLIFLSSIFWVACGGGGGADCVSEVSNTNIEANDQLSINPVPAGGRDTFGLIGVNGEITVTGSSTAMEVTITGTKRVRSESFEDAQARLADIVVDVDLEESPTAVFVETIQPQCTGGRVYEVDYDITLPMNFRVLVTNFNGNVTVDTIDDDVSVVLFNGDINLGQSNGINGSASAALTNGTINAGDADNNVGITLPLNGKIEFNVVNGTINLSIPVNTSAEFLASTVNGSINLSQNLVLNPVLQTPNPLEGTLGAGEGTIDLEIKGNGDINVSDF